MSVIACQASPPYDWTPLAIEEPANYADEQMGTKEKFWFSAPDGRRWLFKFARHHEEVNGADWAEVLVHVIANGLGLPSACVRLATYKGERGILVRSVLAEGDELEHGNELLAGTVTGYDRARPRQNPLYSLENIEVALREVGSVDPHHWESGFEQLAGYLMLDALVAARDRHHENWAVVVAHSGERTLAPTFDHGNALGFAERPDRVRVLAEDDQRLDTWVRRGRSHHFAGKPSLVDVAAAGLRMCSATSRDGMLQRLEAFDPAELVEVASRLPNHVMSVDQRSLVFRIVDVNRRRLLDEFAG